MEKKLDNSNVIEVTTYRMILIIAVMISCIISVLFDNINFLIFIARCCILGLFLEVLLSFIIKKFIKWKN